MLPRLLLILTILVHQLALPGVVVASSSEPCAEPACCAAVEVMTCCEERVVPAHCTCGDDCACRGSTSPDAPLPALVVVPAAPKLVVSREFEAVVDRIVAVALAVPCVSVCCVAPPVLRAGRLRLTLDAVFRL